MNSRIKIMSLLLFWAIVLSGCQSREVQFITSSEEIEEEALTMETQSAAEQTPEETSSDTAPAYIYIDVRGAVSSPGVYQLEEGSRVFEAIAMAGGLRADAADHAVNQAQLLTDGQQLYVPTQGEVDAGLVTADQGSIQAAGLSGSTQADSSKININTAASDQLQTLSGIGEAKAQAIISYREQNGPFGSIEEIKNVSGIGDATFEKIKDSIVIG